MLLRRFSNAFRKQDWFTVSVETLIVVFGVFIGIQLSNWNTARIDELAYQEAMSRLAEESQLMLEYANDSREYITTMLSDVQPAIKVLRECDSGASAEKTVNKGLNIIRSSTFPFVVTLTIDQLVTDERLINGQDSNERALLRDFHADLHNIETIKNFVNESVVAVKNDDHSLINFTDVLDPSESFNGTDIRRARLGAPVTVACKDLSFLKRFYNWERAHVYQISLLGHLEDTVIKNADLLNLDLSKPSVEQAP